MTLTPSNYFGAQANLQYMSKSQFRNWQHCPAATLAEIRGEYTRKTSTALLVGSYVDAALDGPIELERFKAEHPEILNSRTGELKADYKKADYIVERALQDRLFSLLTGNAPETAEHVQRQAILVGSIQRVPFRGKADFVLDKTACEIIAGEFPETVEAFGMPFCEGAIVDLKSAKDFAPVWNDRLGARQNWIDAFDYPTQGAVYTELYRQMTGKSLPFIIVAVTKEDEPDITAEYVPQSEMAAALRIVQTEAPAYQKIKKGKATPVRCEKCEYCKQTKRLTGIRNYKES